MSKRELYIYNSRTRKKELFTPILEDRVGMYVCGPTVYSDVHLGNCRTFMAFDVMYRYLTFLGYKVRYVRNITDVGHLENDLEDSGEDKIAKKARLEQLEPMEIVQRYTQGFHDVMKMLNTISPSIEPSATGHIIEQIDMIQDIIDRGYGYERNGSVYFNTRKVSGDFKEYGELSGRKIDELFNDTRELKSQDEKDHPSDFAIWMKAGEQHIMRWNSPWSVGFPGWHLECSAMSTKYLGEKFDIHGGGMDLQFPHHENEIAQNLGACGCTPSNYWIHSNMLTLNGKKMSKRDGSSILPGEMFTGENALFEKDYSPMTLRFLTLQTHYRSTLDLSEHALSAAEKGYRKLMEVNQGLQVLTYSGEWNDSELDKELTELIGKTFEHLSDDFNTPMALARLFDITPRINSIIDGKILLNDIQESTLENLKTHFNTILTDIFGLLDETKSGGGDEELLDGLMELILSIRKDARENKDWGTSDKIRDTLSNLEVVVKDSKDKTTWSKR